MIRENAGVSIVFEIIFLIKIAVMFTLWEFEEVVRIKPTEFNKDIFFTIKNDLNSRLANKVIWNVGLAIALYDIKKIGDSHILPGDGAHHNKVEYRYIIFRPFVDEIIIGKVYSCDAEQVCISVEFFKDIIVPASSLPHPSTYNEQEGVWFWEYEVDGSKHNLFLEKEQLVKVKVTGEKFVEVAPVKSDGKSCSSSLPKQIPYMVMARMNGPGLGPISWWDGV